MKTKLYLFALGLAGLAGCTATPGSITQYGGGYPRMDVDPGYSGRYPAPEYWNRYPGWNRYLNRDSNLDSPQPSATGTAAPGIIIQPNLSAQPETMYPMPNGEVPPQGDRIPAPVGPSTNLVFPENNSNRVAPTINRDSDVQRLEALKARLGREQAGKEPNKPVSHETAQPASSTTPTPPLPTASTPTAPASSLPPNGNRTRSGLLIYAPPSQPTLPATPDTAQKPSTAASSDTHTATPVEGNSTKPESSSSENTNPTP